MRRDSGSDPNRAVRSSVGRQRLGACPDCGATIPADRLLATFERAEEWPRMLAECSACAEIVAPR